MYLLAQVQVAILIFEGELLLFIQHDVATKWKSINIYLPPSQVKTLDLSIRNTSAEARLWLWLVLTIPISLDSGGGR